MALYRRMLRDDPILTVTGAMILFLAVPTALALGLDARMLDGEPIWLKPLKFQLSVGLFLLTLAFFARFLPERLRQRPVFRAYAGVVAVSALAEIVWIGAAAALGVRSHFNESSELAFMLYNVMGAVAVTLTSGALVYGVAIWRHAAAPLGAGLRHAIGLGLVLTFALTVPVAGTMSVLTPLVGAAETGLAVPVLGWSREAGDLRVAHFFATHAMHLVPLAALMLGGALTVRRARGLALGFAGLTAALFAQALAGQPLIPV